MFLLLFFGDLFNNLWKSKIGTFIIFVTTIAIWNLAVDTKTRKQANCLSRRTNTSILLQWISSATLFTGIFRKATLTVFHFTDAHFLFFKKFLIFQAFTIFKKKFFFTDLAEVNETKFLAVFDCRLKVQIWLFIVSLGNKHKASILTHRQLPIREKRQHCNIFFQENILLWVILKIVDLFINWKCCQKAVNRSKVNIPDFKLDAHRWISLFKDLLLQK